MATIPSTWTFIGKCPESGVTAYGCELLESFRCDDIILNKRPHWLKSAIKDVISTLPKEAQGPIFEAKNVKIYRQLKIVLPARGLLHRIFFWRKSPERARRGMVYTGQPITIFFSEEGMRSPPVVYEEVAHATSILVSADSHSAPKKVDPTFRVVIANLLTTETPKVREFIKCHWMIFRGFLNNSDALKATTNRRELSRVESAFNTCDTSCKLLFSNQPENGKCNC